MRASEGRNSSSEEKEPEPQTALYTATCERTNAILEVLGLRRERVGKPLISIHTIQRTLRVS